MRAWLGGRCGQIDVIVGGDAAWDRFVVESPDPWHPMDVDMDMDMDIDVDGINM